MQKSNEVRLVNRGEVFWFDPLKETKVNSSPLALVLSGRLQNQYGDHLIILVVNSKTVFEVRDFFELICEVEGMKLKVSFFAIHTVGKEFFLRKAKYLGKIDKKIMKKINEKVKLILELDSC